ncbi:unnamed protein product, partial [Urochloa humidicola]
DRDTIPPTISSSGRVINYEPPSDEPYIGRNAPSVNDILKGKDKDLPTDAAITTKRRGTKIRKATSKKPRPDPAVAATLLLGAISSQGHAPIASEPSAPHLDQEIHSSPASASRTDDPIGAVDQAMSEMSSSPEIEIDSSAREIMISDTEAPPQIPPPITTDLRETTGETTPIQPSSSQMPTPSVPISAPDPLPEVPLQPIEPESVTPP